MTEYFTQQDYLNVKSQRNKTLLIFYGVLVLFAILSAGLFIWYRTLPYGSSTISTIKMIQHALSVIFVVFAFLYLGIVYKRVNKFYR
jgi:cytochrome b subunit of formate dehydrogenase